MFLLREHCSASSLSILASGHLPFDGRDKEEIKRAITLGRMRALPPHLSADCVAFISDMLESDPETRPSAAQLLRHPYIARHSSRGVGGGGCGADAVRLAPVADATAYITSSWGQAADGSKQASTPSPPLSRNGIPPGFGRGAGKPAGWRDVRLAAPSPQQAQAGFRPPLQPTVVNGAPSPGPPSPPQKHGPYRSSESEWPAQQQLRGGDTVYPRDSGLQYGLTDSPAGPMTMRRAGSGTSLAAAPPLTPQPPQQPRVVSSQRLTSHSSFGSVSFYNAEMEPPAHAAVAGELIRARHWEVFLGPNLDR